MLFIVAYAVRRLSSVPSIVVYITLGLLLGAFVDKRSEVVDFFSEIGRVLLFFFLCLEFPIERIVSVARKICTAGVLDLIINFRLGFFVGYFLHFDITACIFLGAITYASS